MRVLAVHTLEVDLQKCAVNIVQPKFHWNRLRTSDYPPCAHRVSYMDIRLRDLRKDKKNLDDFVLHLSGCRTLVTHHVEQRRR